MGNQLPPLGTKSSVARLPDSLVRRPRLDVLLADRERRPVTLICAPPGAGKTTLVTAWLRSRVRRDVVPLTTDWRDNERGRFARVVVAALMEAGAIPSERVRGGRSGTTLLDAAFGQLERRRVRRTLVLDDLQELTSPDALTTLTYLVERAPAVLDLVLCSRADPPIRLGRLRLEGKLGEIRNDTLGFTLAESAELLSAHGLRLSRSQVHALWQRTQGWVAGLCLAAWSLRTEADPREFVRSAATSEAAIADYLLKELLSRQDEGVQQFLLRTSVVERLTPDLARALTDDDAARERLLELERNGVFLVELEDRTWYRYHALFAALLNARLRHRHRQLVDELHRRAAAWYGDNEMPAEAEAHARTAGDWATVGALASRRWVERTLAGDEPGEELLTASSSQAITTASAGLALVATVDACHRRDRAAADTCRWRLDELVAADGGAAQEAGAPPLARALLDVAYARAFGADTRARDAVAAVHAMPEVDGSHAMPARLADLWSIELDLDEGQIDRARHEAAELAQAAESTWIGAEALARLALAEATDGAVLGAIHHAEQSVAGPAPKRDVVLHAATLALALCHAMRGEQRHAVDLMSALDVPWRVDRALRSVDRAVRATLRTPGAPFVALEVDVFEHPLVSRALISLGVLETMDGTGRVHVVGGRPEEAVLLARQRWGSGDRGGTLAVLERCVGPEMKAGHPRTMVEHAAFLALARAGQNSESAVVTALREALFAAETTGIRAPLLVLGTELAALLDTYANDLGPNQSIALELVDRARRSPAPAFVEPLTERETAVLRRLPTLMSNHEIADGMHVSVNTVKTHLKSLYRKLGVTSRREAVLRGRSLELL